MKGKASDLALLKKSQIIFTLQVGLFKDKSEFPRDNNKTIKVKANEYWNYELIDNKFDFLIMYPSPPHPTEAPARAYSKILEAQKTTSLAIKKGDSVVEIGSAPGGISYYLLNLGTSLTAIDPAEMDPSLNLNYSKNFNHLKMSIFDVERKHLPHKVDWVISDLNLNGDLNVNQSIKVIRYYPELKGAFLTIKIPNPEDIKKINDWKKLFSRKFQIEVMNLPAHKKEIGFVLKKIN